MSNHLKRILTATISIPLIVFLSIVGDVYFFLFVAIISAISLSEFYKLAELKGAKPIYALGIIAGFCINLSFYHYKLQSYITEFVKSQGVLISFPTQAQLLIITVIVIIVVLSIIELFRNNGSHLINLSSTLLGLFYISLFFGTFIGLREVFNPFDFPVLRYFASETSFGSTSVINKIYNLGGYTVIAIFVTIWICDSTAFYGGKLFGRYKLFQRVSPNKTWEGAIFGFVFAVLTAISAKYFIIDYLSLFDSIIIGLIVGIFGQFGDLVESMLKRDVGVKDSSNIIPGHGGFLDRFDSLLFVSPIVYLYIDFVVFG